MLPCAPDMTDAGVGRDETDETVDARSPGWCYYSTLCAGALEHDLGPAAGRAGTAAEVRDRSTERVEVWSIVYTRVHTEQLYMYVENVRLGCD